VNVIKKIAQERLVDTRNCTVILLNERRTQCFHKRTFI